MTSLSDKEKTRAFAEKMRKEGAAGFGAGPWMSWEENGCLENPIIEGQVIPGDRYERTGNVQQHTITGDRFFTWVASMAFIALLIGIVGVYLTPDQQAKPATVATIESPTISSEEATNNMWETDEAAPPATVSAIAENKRAVETSAAPDAATTPATTVDSWANSSTNIWATSAETPSSSDESPAQIGESPEDATPAAGITQIEIPAEPAEDIMTTQAATPEPTPAPAPESEAGPESEQVTESTPSENREAEKPAGPWQVNIESYFKAKRAIRRLAELQAMGIDAEQTIAEVNGKTVYRLGVSGFKSRKAAQVHGDALKQQHGLDSIWINKR